MFSAPTFGIPPLLNVAFGIRPYGFALRIELRNRQAQLCAAVLIDSGWRQRIDGLARAVHAKRKLIHFCRAEGMKQGGHQAGAMYLIADGKLRPIVAAAQRGQKLESALRCLVVLDQPDIERGVWRNVVVGAQNRIAPRLLVDADAGPVILTARADRVRQREQAEQLLPIRIDAVGGNNVALRTARA